MILTNLLTRLSRGHCDLCFVGAMTRGRHRYSRFGPDQSELQTALLRLWVSYWHFFAQTEHLRPETTRTCVILLADLNISQSTVG